MGTIFLAAHRNHRYTVSCRRREPREKNGKAKVQQQRMKLIFHFRRLWRQTGPAARVQSYFDGAEASNAPTQLPKLSVCTRYMR